MFNWTSLKKEYKKVFLRRTLFIKFIVLLVLCCTACERISSDRQASRKVVVSIAPYNYFLKRLCEPFIEVSSLVPSGINSHTHELTARQAEKLYEADIWFRIGEPFEYKMLDAAQDYLTHQTIVDLRNGLKLLPPDPSHTCHHHHHGADDEYDIHIWLSPVLMQQQVGVIAKILIKQYPELADEIQSNANEVKQELEGLYLEIQEQLKPFAGSVLLVGHPAYTYFCDTFQLKQHSIEFEGKEPQPKQLHNLYELALSLSISKVFVQPQHNTRGAEKLAEMIGAEVIVTDPYSEDYLEELRFLVREIIK